MAQTTTLTAEHEAFRRTVREFAEAEIAPYVAQWDREHHFPVDVVRKMGDLGLFGLTAPEEYGGAAGDFTSVCLAIEELGRIDQSIGITLEAAVGLGISPILTYGTANILNGIWFGRKMVADIADGIVYGLITGAIFAALWPAP